MLYVENTFTTATASASSIHLYDHQKCFLCELQVRLLASLEQQSTVMYLVDTMNLTALSLIDCGHGSKYILIVFIHPASDSLSIVE